MLERTLLCGSPQKVQDWLAGTRNLSAQGVDVAGYLADPDGPGGSQPALAGGTVPWLGPRDQMLEVVRRYRISQVVFWERPAAGSTLWTMVAGLRRLQVRLRWNLEDVWLLAAGARAELFGNEPSAVLGVGGAAAVRMLADRLVAFLSGVVLGCLAGLPWLWLKLVRVPAGRGRVVEIEVADLWGHRFPLRVATGNDGKVLSLIWQWRLSGPLLRGRLALAGPRPAIGNTFALPGTAREILAFWSSNPHRPGLTGWGGDWNVGADGSGDPTPSCWCRFRSLVTLLWRNPGGFGYIHKGPGDDEEAGPNPQDGNEDHTI